MASRVLIRVYLGCGTELTFKDCIEEKYPFWCDDCGDYHREGKYPWKLETEIIEEPGWWQDTTSGRVFIPEAPVGTSA